MRLITGAGQTVCTARTGQLLKSNGLFLPGTKFDTASRLIHPSQLGAADACCDGRPMIVVTVQR